MIREWGGRERIWETSWLPTDGFWFPDGLVRMHYRFRLGVQEADTHWSVSVSVSPTISILPHTIFLFSCASQWDRAFARPGLRGSPMISRGSLMHLMSIRRE